MAQEHIEAMFEVGASPWLLVSNVRGSITLQSEERKDILVTAVKRPDRRGDPARTEVQMYQDGDRVTVKTHYRQRGRWLAWLRGDRVCAVDYVVRAPAHCAVRVSQVTGDVQIEGFTNRVKVRAVEGAVKLRELAGRTQVNAVSATVRGDGWRGRAQVDTVSGPVQINAAQLSRFKAKVISGDLSLETTLDDRGHYDFESVSGDVTLYLPPEQGLESRGATLSGRLRCDLPHEFTRRGHGGWRATINGGGPALRFNSVSGDLRVLASADLATTR